MNNKNLKPFKLFALKNFPFIEADFDAITNYELLCKIVEYLNNVINSQNEVIENVEELSQSFTELKNYVDNYFENLDVQEEINNKIDSMIENGTFDEIIDKYTIGKDVFRTRLYLTKLGRLNLTELANNGYSNMQAGCYVGDDYYIFPVIKNNEEGEARLYKLNLATGSVLTYNDVTGIYHANGCCQKGDKLYFTQTFDNTTTALYGIVEVDINTLNITETYTVDFGNITPFQINSIGYDSKEDKFYLIGEDYYAVCDSEFVVSSRVALQYPHKNYKFNQGGCFYDRYICVLINSENAVLCFNKDGSLHHIIDIGKIQANNVFGEIENITVYNNEMYFNSNLIHSNYQNLFLAQFFKANLSGGGLSSKYSNNTVFVTSVLNNIVVDKTTYNNLNDYNKFTCNGTSSKPFESIAEAISYMSNDELYQINVADTNSYNENLTIVNKNLIIKAGGSTLGTIKIVGSKVNFTNFYIDKSEFRSAVYGSPDDYNTPLYISSCSEVNLMGTCGYKSADCISDGMIYPLILEGSTLYDNSTVSGDYKKFLDVNSTYMPLIIDSTISTGNVGAIKNPVMNFVDYKPSTSFVTGHQNISFSSIPQYTTPARGLWVCIWTSIAASHYVRLNTLHANDTIILEDVTGGTDKKYGFRVSFRPSNSRIEIDPYSYDHSTNTWSADNTIQYFVSYMFEI